ncbi:hypothetical protein ONS95_003568 [Cadophora gregata]|uniref:uncharacterized protein n=1 Tax=Cadophora gregata TaxID=51156 RepID=UPI0026DBABA9|nr:uncharacterized protein ONS95_003568 [Cadophora gregata]KAK0106846.1 hypothetical protein ONS95_003568 [Cadophora gregata]
MKLLNIILVSSALHGSQTLAAFRPDLQENVQVAEIEPDQRVSDGATEITLKAYPGSDFEIAFKCTDDTKQFTFADHKHWVACCRPGQKLLGSEFTAFDCCDPSQELLGSKGTGYRCCPIGKTYDECTGVYKPVATCPGAETLINGQCTCPSGTYRASNGVCEALKCSSGVQSGKCYTFTLENGHRFGYNSAGFYTASEESRAQQFGKFKLCTNEYCSASTDINPGQPFYIKDIHGTANGGQHSKQWLNNAKDGSHITKTAHFSQAGLFTITKWPCGKYCLSGKDRGVGPTCPTEMLGATFTTADDQSCVPLTLLEVPCDVRSLENNCIWDTKKKQCAGEEELAACRLHLDSTSPITVNSDADHQFVF